MQPFAYGDPHCINGSGFMGPEQMDYSQFAPPYANMCNPMFVAPTKNPRDPLSRGPNWTGGGMGADAPSNALRRKGSIYQAQRDRETQKTVNMWGVFGPTTEDISAQFYGDMAYRNAGPSVNGLRPVRTVRGGVEDGQDFSKPRRVCTRRNLQDRGSTGYGGIAFKRAVCMSNGEPVGIGQIPVPLMFEPEPCPDPGLPWESLESDQDNAMGTVGVFERVAP